MFAVCLVCLRYLFVFENELLTRSIVSVLVFVVYFFFSFVLPLFCFCFCGIYPLHFLEGNFEKLVCIPTNRNKKRTHGI